MTTAILAENLKVLMAYHVQYSTQAALGKASNLDQRTIGRMLNQEHSCGLKQLEALALVFDLLTYQLLVPNLDPKNPAVCKFTKAERDLHKALRMLIDQLPEQ